MNKVHQVAVAIVLHFTVGFQFSHAQSDCCHTHDSNSGGLGLTAYKDLLWKNGTTITYKFLDGGRNQRDKVRTYASIWTVYANLKFKEVAKTQNSDIKITFNTKRNSSRIGIGCRSVAQNQPSMSLGNVNDTAAVNNSSPSEVRTILHEFGHAIGLTHEHFHKDTKIPWDRAAVIKEYVGKPGFEEVKDIERNILNPPKSSRIYYSSEYDPKSIMHYPVPNRLTFGNFELGLNTKLSDMDCVEISRLYPPTFPWSYNVNLKSAAAVQSYVDECRRKGMIPVSISSTRINGKDQHAVLCHGKGSPILKSMGVHADPTNDGFGARVIVAEKASQIRQRVNKLKELRTVNVNVIDGCVYHYSGLASCIVLVTPKWCDTYQSKFLIGSTKELNYILGQFKGETLWAIDRGYESSFIVFAKLKNNNTGWIWTHPKSTKINVSQRLGAIKVDSFYYKKGNTSKVYQNQVSLTRNRYFGSGHVYLDKTSSQFSDLVKTTKGCPIDLDIRRKPSGDKVVPMYNVVVSHRVGKR